MKTKLSLMLSGLLLLAGLPAWATTTTFTVSATIPTATGIGITVSSVNSTTNAFTKLDDGTTALSFDTMTFNTTNNIYLPDHYFALDFAATGGAGEPDLTFTYTEGANPNGSSNGLGTKSSATFAKEVSNGTTTTETLIGSKQTLGSLSSFHLPFTDFTGGFARAYIAICTGASTDPTGCKPFSNADAPGAYNGSLAATAVVN
jgi:hypothetical protein